MRDIRFRGKKKSPYGDKWVYGYYAFEDGEHVIVMPHSTSYAEALKENRPLPHISVKHSIDFNTLGQFTGLYDKNKVPIYEGDILNFDDENWIVSFEDGKFIGTFDNTSYDIFEISHYEVIGNIYGNPDLLGG